MTRRLYYEDPYLTRFEARVVRQVPGERPGVVLDQTAFFPTGGGQPNDLGTLNGVAVLDVVEQGDEVVHVVAGTVDGAVRGVVDEERRRDHMQQHHGQHILSEAFVRVCDGETTSFHLGKDLCTIDLNRSGVSSSDLERAEDLANSVVFENRPVASGFFSREEAAKLPTRKPPPEGARIRIVHIREFDCSPCCGTHPARTGDVGTILIVGAEGGRIQFVCGKRASVYARESVATIRSLMSRLSCGRVEVAKSVERLQADLVAARKALAAADRLAAEHRAKELAASAPPVGKVRMVVEVFEGKDGKYLQTVANGIVSSPGMVAVLGGTGASSSVALARSKDVNVDLRPILQEALAVLGGKGGGAPHFCQGGGDGKDVAAALRIAKEKIVANLSA